MRRTMIALGTTASAALAGFLIGAAPAAATAAATAATTAANTATTGAAAVTGAGAAVAGAVQDAAARTTAAVTRSTRLTVTVRPSRGPAKIVRLSCKPAGGTHPRAADACAALTTAGGNPAAIEAEDAMCTAEFAPVRATVVGYWQGRPVRYKKTFSNGCQMRIATGALFDI